MLTGHIVFLRNNENAQLLARSVLLGAIVALILGTSAVISQMVGLAQFQPMRIFYWVWLFAHVLIILSTIRALEQRSPAGLFLLGYLVLTITESLWALPFVPVTLAYLILRALIERRPAKRQLDLAARWTTPFIFAACTGGWLVGHIARIDMETLRSSTSPMLLGLLATLALWGRVDNCRRFALIFFMIVVALIGVTNYRYAYYAARVDANWRAAQLWSREKTEVTDKFIVTPDAEKNFRTISFRTALGEPMSALCWVDPLECQRSEQLTAAVEETNLGGVWHLSHLVTLARDWNAQYILVRGAWDGNERSAEPVFHSGEYVIFRVP